VAVDVFAAAAQVLLCSDPDEKIRLTRDLFSDWNAGRLNLIAAVPATIDEPGRPPSLRLVHPRLLPRRNLHTDAGRAALIHAITHIEFNAINLALDAVCRFTGLPADYYSDWLRVASEEAYHFNLLRERLRTLHYDYGDWPGHDGLWDMAQRTSHDPLVRMALVPRVLEARGLDVTPAMIDKLRQAGDEQTATVLGIILRDEIGHVEIGTRWFRYLCAQRSLDPEQTFSELLKQHFNGELRGPFNNEARLRAGFSPSELATLAAGAGKDGT
jgi:uncharacterized ferritin-like protein (DUF455 family)